VITLYHIVQLKYPLHTEVFSYKEIFFTSNAHQPEMHNLKQQ